VFCFGDSPEKHIIKINNPIIDMAPMFFFTTKFIFSMILIRA